MGNVRIRLIKMNDLSISHDEELTFNSPVFNKFKELKEINDELSQNGMSLSIPDIVITDSNKFAEYVLRNLFPSYIVEDTQNGQETGHPDYRLEKENTRVGQNRIYVELKNNTDTLSKQQLAWMTENRDRYSIYVLDLNFDKPSVGWNQRKSVWD